MRRLIVNSIINFFISNCTRSRNVRSLLVTWHMTHRCNLNCFFCEHCGIAHNEHWKNEGELSTAEAMRLLDMLSRQFPILYITGGEPFLRDDAVTLFDKIKKLSFKRVAVNTNLSMFERILQSIDAIDELIVSIDSIDPCRFDEIRGVKGMGKKILENFEKALVLQESKKIRLAVNCVVTPTTIEDARGVMRFCINHGIRVAMNAQNDKHGPVKGLLKNADFHKFIGELLDAKKKTGLVIGTRRYFERMFDFQLYDCYPFLTPRINAKGDLAWPCDNLEQWVPRIVDVENWKEAVKLAKKMYGPIPDCKCACQFQCYIEPSLMIKRPWVALGEYL